MHPDLADMGRDGPSFRSDGSGSSGHATAARRPDSERGRSPRASDLGCRLCRAGASDVREAGSIGHTAPRCPRRCSHLRPGRVAHRTGPRAGGGCTRCSPRGGRSGRGRGRPSRWSRRRHGPHGIARARCTGLRCESEESRRPGRSIGRRRTRSVGRWTTLRRRFRRFSRRLPPPDRPAGILGALISELHRAGHRAPLTWMESRSRTPAGGRPPRDQVKRWWRWGRVELPVQDPSSETTTSVSDALSSTARSGIGTLPDGPVTCP